jgi:hypothetical protein
MLLATVRLTERSVRAHFAPTVFLFQAAPRDVGDSRGRSRVDPCSPRWRTPGELTIVLHTHMPHVEGFGSGRSARSGGEGDCASYLPLGGVLGAPIALR